MKRGQLLDLLFADVMELLLCLNGLNLQLTYCRSKDAERLKGFGSSYPCET